MSINKFTLTEDHIKLLKQLNITEHNNIPIIDANRLFGNQDMYEDVDLILNGKTKEVGPDDTWEEDGYSEEQRTEWDKLISELPTALDIILNLSTFEPGDYVTRSYERNWIKK